MTSQYNKRTNQNNNVQQQQQHQQSLTSLVQDEGAFLRDQLSNCARLLKCSLKANRPFDSQMRNKVSDLIARVECSLDAKDRQSSNEKLRVMRVTEQASELQSLIEKQDVLTKGLQRQVRQYENDNEQLKVRNSQVEGQLELLQSQVAKQKEDNCKAIEERDLSREQNKKLVELLQRMERKISDKNNREEELEDQNLQLREMTKLMTTQVEKIERELESKLVKKDETIFELRGRLEAQKQVEQYNLDLDQDLEELEELESQLETRK